MNILDFVFISSESCGLSKKIPVLSKACLVLDYQQEVIEELGVGVLNL